MLQLMRAGLVAALLGVSWPAFAQSDGPPGSEPAIDAAIADQSTDDKVGFRAQGGLGFEVIGEDLLLGITLGLSFDQENFGVGAQLPLRFRLWDREPKTADFGGLRREDWDQPGDFLRLLRYAYIGRRDKRGPFYVRIGELNHVSIGHGTIVHRYRNNLDANRWRTGIDARVEYKAVAGEFMMADIAGPYVFGFRGSLRPVDVFTEAHSHWGHKLIIGQSFFIDARAPYILETNVNGRLVIDDQGDPKVEREKVLVVLGLLDVAYEVIDTEMFRLTPYMDFNKITRVSGGWGAHFGVTAQLKLPIPPQALQVDGRLEYRRVSGDYVGPYFDSVYDIERFQRLGRNGGSQRPKLLALCLGDPDCPRGGSARDGVFFEGRAGLPDWAMLAISYSDYGGPRPDGQFRMGLEVPALDIFRFSAFYFRVNVDGADDIFRIDDKSAVVMTASVPLVWIFRVQAKWWRIWRSCGAGEVSCGDNQSGYASVDDWSISGTFDLEL